MSTLDIVFDINKQYQEDDLVPAKEALEEKGFSVAPLTVFCDSLGIDQEHVYYSEGRIPEFFYYDFPIYFEVHQLGEPDEMFAERYRYALEHIPRIYAEEDWVNYLYVTKGLCSTIIFRRIFNQIKPQEKYQVLREFYVMQYHGHTQITKEMWKEAIQNREEGYTPTLPYEADTYTVYRGAGSKSADVEQAVSWTLDLMTAAKFAFRGEDQAVIYKGTVKKEDIVDYFDERDEFEVIAQAQNIQDLEIWNQYNSIHLFQQLSAAQLVDEYNYYKNTFIKEENFLIDSKLHGALHTKRVLLNALTLAFLDELDVRDRAILANAAMYHDVGRTTDGVDEEHGRKSREMMNEYSLPLYIIDCQNTENGEPYRLDMFSEEEEEMIQLIVEYHAKSDEMGLADKVTENLTANDAERYKRLYRLFKDADGLDRVRLEDINDKYFRSPHTKQLLTYALRMLQQIR